jgi:PTS system ascorbate-specific IIA component
LTDIIGTTPSNIAKSIDYKNIRVVAGLNLSMLLNVFNYSTDSLNQLANRAVDGGVTGIMKL